jgi:hypothetical protein
MRQALASKEGELKARLAIEEAGRREAFERIRSIEDLLGREVEEVKNKLGCVTASHDELLRRNQGLEDELRKAVQGDASTKALAKMKTCIACIPSILLT